MRKLTTLFASTALLVGLAMAPAVQAQLVVDIGVPPVCSYGYYDYAPYACAPYGFYGPGYFYGGIFLAWAMGRLGYGHGWVDIASATVAEEVIAAAVAPWPIAAALRVAVGQQAVVVRSTAARGLTMLVGARQRNPLVGCTAFN